MTKEEFWDALDNLFIDDTTVSHSENKKTLENVALELRSIVPEKLFRYRSFDASDYNINALRKNEIWASCLSTMNDCLEFDPYWNPDKILELSNIAIKEMESLDFSSIPDNYCCIIQV